MGRRKRVLRRTSWRWRPDQIRAGGGEHRSSDVAAIVEKKNEREVERIEREKKRGAALSRGGGVHFGNLPCGDEDAHSDVASGARDSSRR